MISKRIVLHFPFGLVDQPILCQLVKEYNLTFNILKASINPKEEGILILELSGKNSNYKQGIQYLKQIGIEIQSLSQDVVRDEEKCTDCGVCVPICPTNALLMDAKTNRIQFLNEKCVVCELCVKACPYQAMEVHF